MISRVFVPGVPTPQGSTKSYVVKGRAVTTSDNPRTRPWRQVVGAVLRQHLHCGAIAYPVGAVALVIECVMPRRAADMTQRVQEWSPSHVSKPDLDKLARAILDALTGILYRDDSQVVRIVASKRYATLGTGGELEQPGVHLAWAAVPELPRPQAVRRRARASGAAGG